MLSANDLSTALLNALPQKTDGHGAPIPPPGGVVAYAHGIVAVLQAGSVSNASGTINGTTIAGAPLIAGSGIGGIMVLSPGPLIAQTANAFDGAPKISSENLAIVAYLSASGTVTFPSGTITGQATSTPTSPGTLTAGAGSGGMIVGLSGAAAAAAVGATGPSAIAFYNALCNYIMSSASVSYASGSVKGVAPPASGPLSAGLATGGTIA